MAGAGTINIITTEQRVDLINEEAWVLRHSNTQHALEMAQEAYDLSISLDYILGTAQGLRTLAVCNQLLFNYDSSLRYCFEALTVFESLDEEKGKASVLSCIGTNYFSLGDYESSLMFHNNALKLREHIHNQPDQSSSLFSIGNVYAAIGDYEKALSHYLKSERLAKELSDKALWAKVVNGIGGIHMVRRDNDKAIECFIQSVNIKKEKEDIRSTASTLCNMGECYIELGEFENARECLMESKKIAVEFGDRHIEASCMQTFGRLFLANGKLPESIDQVKRSLGIFDELKSKREQSNCHKLLAEAYSRLGDYKVAYEHLNRYFLLKEEVASKESAKKIENMILVRQIETMQNESVIERLKNVELKTAYQQIEDKNRNILDSIEYAKYLQETLLPHEEDLKQSFPDSFVFLQPKDIVSGDFYLHYRVEDIVLLAVVDCTGHGVPGAFMSLSGNNIIENIIKVEKVYEPKQVLKKLNNKILEKFERKDEKTSVKNGMDLGFCAINLGSLELLYSGAHCPLYLIREGELKEIPSNRLVIGSARDQEFEQHRLQLQKNDILYLFSDGYADQKGGERRVKFYYPPFKKLLLEISSHPMPLQLEKLRSNFEAWKGKENQTDDVTVVGVRL